MARAITITLIIVSVVCLTNSIFVIDKHQLDSLLCQEKYYLDDNTIISLFTNITHEITSQKQCLVNVAQSLVITSQSPTKSAVIQCLPATQTNSGFVFNSVSSHSSLYLQRVKFINCGANLTLLSEAELNLINSTKSFYFTSHHAAVLILSQLYYASMHNVTISKYFGFAMIAHNLYNGSFHSIEVRESLNWLISQHTGHSIGDGTLILYQQQPFTPGPGQQYSLSIVKSLFALNYVMAPPIGCNDSKSLYDSFENYDGPVINAGGLTILYLHCQIPAQVTISQSNFSSNYGITAMLIIHQNAHLQSQTLINGNTLFESHENFYSCGGGVLSSIVSFGKDSCPMQQGHHFVPIFINNATFSNNGINGLSKTGAVSINTINGASIPIYFHFLHVTFEFNYAHSGGSCINAKAFKSSNVELILESMQVYNNSSPMQSIYHKNSYHLSPVFNVQDFYMITINGSSHNHGKFCNNFGTVFNILRSDVTLSGYLKFTKNFGINGGVITLLGPNCIYLDIQGLNAIFLDNKGETLGGAINADTGNVYSKGKCTFQITGNNLEKIANISVLLIGNTASIAGNSVYTTSAYECLLGNKSLSNNQLIKYYENIFRSSSMKKFISANAITIARCNTQKTYFVYPGQTFSIPMRASDAMNNSAYAVVTFSAVQSSFNEQKRVNWFFGKSETVQVIQELPFDQCTNISVTVHTTDTSTINIKSNIFLLFSQMNGDSLLRINVNLNHCPIGFTLGKVTGVCVCSSIIYQLSSHPKFKPQCNISTQSFSRPFSSSWAGNVYKKGELRLAVSSSCYENYCNSDSKADSFILNSTGSYIQNSHTHYTETVCRDFRNGTLCGQCQEGYSVVIGSTKCKKCNNMSLLIILAYIIAGPLFIYFIFAFKLTLTTGTLNGVIFFAQATLAGVIQYLSNQPSSVIKHCIKFFLSSINLRLSFPLCLYDGMTELLKSGFLLLFPIYLLAIVVGLIIISQYSVRLSNKIAGSSVQVLVTVVHTSFTNLLASIIYVFTPATIYTKDGPYTVWYYDGTVDYAGKGHIILMTVTLVIVFTLILPYLLILLLPKSLRRHRKLNEWSRPILESIYAPYKQGRHYWFVGRLLMLILMYLLYAVIPSCLMINIAFGFLVVFFVIFQTVFNPYINKWNNALDFWLMINLSALFFTLGSQHLRLGAYPIIILLLYILTFATVFTIHIFTVSKKMKKIKQRLGIFHSSVIASWYNKSNTNNREQSENVQDTYYKSCNRYREPLISPSRSH